MRALMLLALARPATIAVEVDTLALPYAQTEQLHGEVMTRLVEDGHAVGTSGAVVVRLSGGGEMVHIEVAHGRDVRSRDVRGTGALLRLAVVHAVLELLAGFEVLQAADPAITADPAIAVALEVRPDAAAHAAAVIAAALDAGLVVTREPADATRRVCVGDREGAATFAIVASSDACPDDAEVVASPSELAIALRRPLPSPPPEPSPPEPEPESEPAAVPTSTEITKPASPTKARVPAWTGAVGVGLGAQGRLRPVEAVVALHGDARHRTGALLTARLTIAPSTAPAVAIADTFVTVGAGYAWWLGARVQLDVALAGGIAIHGYRVGDDRGVRLDGTFELPVGVAVAVAPRVSLRAAVTGGVDTRARSHRRSEEVVWSRDPWRVSGILGIDVMVGRKPSPRSRAERAGR